MGLKTNLKKIGTSHHVLIPSSIIKVFGLLEFTEEYEYRISVENDGARIILNRTKKLDKCQTTLDQIHTFKKGDNI